LYPSRVTRDFLPAGGSPALSAPMIPPHMPAQWEEPKKPIAIAVANVRSKIYLSCLPLAMNDNGCMGVLMPKAADWLRKSH
jgi:hypothetical protein